jgi:hypothetical protein
MADESWIERILEHKHANQPFAIQLSDLAELGFLPSALRERRIAPANFSLWRRSSITPTRRSAGAQTRFV